MLKASVAAAAASATAAASAADVAAAAAAAAPVLSALERLYIAVPDDDVGTDAKAGTECIARAVLPMDTSPEGDVLRFQPRNAAKTGAAASCTLTRRSEPRGATGGRIGPPPQPE